MTVADNIRALASEARPVIRQAIEAAEILASFSEAAREKGINWTQLKALLVAQEKDAADGGKRVDKLTEKADLALTYSGMLVGSIVSDNGQTRTQSTGPVAAASSQADGNGEAVAPEPADKNAAASTNSPTGSSCPPAGGAVHDKAPQPPCTASSFSDDFNDIPQSHRRTPDGGFVLQ